MLEVIYSCGLRVSELCSLRVMDLDTTQRLVRVYGKGKKERQLPIGAPALQAIGRLSSIRPPARCRCFSPTPMISARFIRG